MERRATQPVNPEEAKVRLRAAATRSETFSWLWSNPRKAIIAAFIIGFVIGTSPTAREALADGLIALLKRSRL
jgi:hypothetical protein